MRSTLARWGAAVCAVGLGSAAAFAQARPLASSGGWEASPADGVKMALARVDGPDGAGFRLTYDFQGRGGYAIARQRLVLDLPDNYQLTFWVRGKGPRNNLEVKLLDTSGLNVWWSVRRDFAFPREWQRLVVKKRHLAFAWGPAGGGDIRRASALEIVVSASAGGQGEVEVSGLTFEPLPAPHPYLLRPALTASSAAPGGEPERALDGDLRTGWHSLPAAGEEQWLEIDFGERRELGGLAVDWDPRDFATRFAVLASTGDGVDWQVLRQVERGGGGGKRHLYLPDAEARRLRLRLLASSRGRGYGVREIAILPVEVSDSPNAFFTAVAKDSPRGSYPRTLAGEQAYWTVVGVDGGRDQALLNEDGLLEAGRAGFSIEPFVLAGGGLVGWSDVRSTPALAAGYLPIPSVVWQRGKKGRAPGISGRTPGSGRAPDRAGRPLELAGAAPESPGARAWRRAGLTLEVTAFAAGAPESPIVYARYRLRNHGAREQRARLFLAVRPFQVNPPWQFLGRPGGAVEIRRIAFDGRSVTVDGDRTRQILVPLTPPAAFGAMTFDEGSLADRLGRGRLPAAAEVSDPFGYASAALAFDLRLTPGAAGEIDLELPLGRQAEEPTASRNRPEDLALPLGRQREDRVEPPAAESGAAGPRLVHARLERLERQVAEGWRARLNGVVLDLPPEAAPLADTLRTALAHILVSRDGPALRPGTRSYARSWIRDGALMSEALLRLGHAQEARDFALWYAGFQGEDGKVPCCVDARGADPVPENDSAGELLYLVAAVYRFTGDRDFLVKSWQHVERAVEYLEILRRLRRTPEYRERAKLAFYGLLPESISHEGYSAHPVHSYWDDFFALRGLSDAAGMALALGKEELAGRYAKIHDEFRRDLDASLARTIAERSLDYIPGSVELGDFDPTSTTIALAPGGALADLPAPELRHTFERYFEEVRKRRAGAPPPDPRRDGPGREDAAAVTSYTPYELRAVGAFVRLGWRERAQELLAGFMADRRPPEWNQWPEVVWQPPRHPAFLGDLPHAWMAAEFIRSVLDLLVYERDADHALVIAAGVPAAWARSRSGVAVRGLATPYGTLGYRLSARGGEARLQLAGKLRMPPGGLVVAWPFEGGPGRPLTVNGRPAELTPGGEPVVRELPADVRLRY